MSLSLRSGVVTGALAAGIAVAAVPAAAQQPAGPYEPHGIERGGVTLAVFGGIYTPLAKLADQGDTLSAELSTKAGFGAELAWWLPSGLGLGVHGTFARPDLTFQEVDPDSGFPIPIELGQTDYLAVTANLMYRPNLGGSAATVLPFFAIGGGLQRVEWPEGSSIDPDGDGTLDTETEPVGTIAAGAHVAFSRSVFLRFEVRDWVWNFDREGFVESKLQNDVLVDVGLGIRLP